MRFLADSNRRTRFCRPLTKPLIQGTDSLSHYFFQMRCKGTTIFLICNTRPVFSFMKSAKCTTKCTAHCSHASLIPLFQKTFRRFKQEPV